MARQIKNSEPSWTLQDAKNRFSAVVDAARRGQPQMVTRRGAPAVVVIAAEDYARLRTIERQAQPSFVDHLLAMPCDDQTFERIGADLRLTEL